MIRCFVGPYKAPPMMAIAAIDIVNTDAPSRAYRRTLDAPRESEAWSIDCGCTEIVCRLHARRRQEDNNSNMYICSWLPHS